MKFALLLVVFVVGTFAAPGPNTFSIINDRIRGLIEDIRQQMPYGWPDSDIPPLAPLLIDYMDVNLESDSLVATGFFENVRVDGLNEFIDEIIQFSLVGLRLTFRIVVPEIVATGHYDMDGRMMGRFPIRGRGNFVCKVREIVVSGHTRLAVRDGFLYMREFVPVVTIGSFVSGFEGLISDQALTSDFINRMLENLIPEMFDLHQETIASVVAGVVIPIADSRLNNMTILDLMTTEPDTQYSPIVLY